METQHKSNIAIAPASLFVKVVTDLLVSLLTPVYSLNHTMNSSSSEAEGDAIIHYVKQVSWHFKVTPNQADQYPYSRSTRLDAISWKSTTDP